VLIVWDGEVEAWHEMAFSCIGFALVAISGMIEEVELGT
jgi:hypothetical protein